MRGDDEKHTGDRERYPSDDCAWSAQLEPRYLCSSKPDPGKEHEQEPDFGKAYAGVMRESEDDGHTQHCPPAAAHARELPDPHGPMPRVLH
jgi:hypothetical protein